MSGAESISQRLQALSGLQAAELRIQWQSCFDVPAPRRLSRDLLIRAIAFRLQEKFYGDGGRWLHKRLGQLAQQVEAGQLPRSDATRTPGTKLMREWAGQMHVVNVVDDAAFEYRGAQYASLSQVARKITGTRWSGPRFFGIEARQSGGAGEETGDG